MKAIPSLRKLQYVVVVSEELHFRKAAERLHVAQPALSRQIREIEDHVGFKILRRDGHFVQLTMAGKLFASGVKKLLEGFESSFDEVHRHAAALSQDRSSEFILAHSPFAPSQLRAKAPELQRNVFRDVTLRLRLFPTSALLTAVAQEDVNAGVTFAPLDAPNLTVVSIGHDHWKAIVPPSHKLFKARSAAIKDFRDLPVISNGADQTHPSLFRKLDEEFKAKGLPFAAISQISSPSEAIDLVRAGAGTVFVPSRACGTLPDGLRAIPIEDISPLELVIVHRKEQDRFIPQLVRSLRAEFATQMATERINPPKMPEASPQRKMPVSISKPQSISVTKRIAV